MTSHKTIVSILNQSSERGSLVTAMDIGDEVAQVGFDWPDAKSALEKVIEEAHELIDCLDDMDTKHQSEELGDLLFSICMVSRKLGMNPEHVLSAANQKFVRRFGAMTHRLSEHGMGLDEASLDQMEQAWLAAKNDERA